MSLTFSYNDANTGDGLYLVIPGSTLTGTPTYVNDTSAQGAA